MIITNRRSVGHKILPVFTLTSGYRPGIPRPRTSPKCHDSSNHVVWASSRFSVSATTWLTTRQNSCSTKSRHRRPFMCCQCQSAPFQDKWSAISAHICVWAYLLEGIMQAKCGPFLVKAENSNVALTGPNNHRRDNLLCYRRHVLISAPFRINGTSFLGVFVFTHMYLKELCKQTMFHFM